MKFSLVVAGDAVVRWCLYAALALTPMFFLPWTLYAVSLNKQVLLTTLVGVAAIAWLVQAISRGEIAYVKSPLNGLMLALTGAVIVSAFFSPARSISFMGVNGGEVDTVMAMITFALLYFLIAGTFQKAEEIQRGFIALAAGATVVIAHATLQMFNGWFLPWDFAQSAEFNTIGTTNALGLFLGGMFVFVFGAAYYDRSWKKGIKIWLMILAAALFIMIVYIGYAPLFIGLAAGVVVMIVADIRSAGKDGSRRSLPPLALIVISVFLLFVTAGSINVALPRAPVSAEVTPSLSTSWKIVKSAARESVKNIFIGSGPSTYQYVYARHRDAALNQSYFWNISFTQGFNALITHLVSWGALGTIIFVAFLAALVREIIGWCLGRRASPIIMAVAATGGYAVITLFIYPQNFTLYFMLFILTGFLVGARAEDSASRAVIALAASPQKTFTGSLVMMLLIMGLLSFGYISGERYVGAVQFEKGLAMANAAGSSESALPFIISAQNRDPRNDLYLQVLGTALLSRANTLVATSTPGTSESQAQLSIAVGAAIEAARRSTQVNPNNAVNWMGLARVYEAVLSFTDGAAAEAFAAYEQARAREPNNPAIPASLGRTHIIYADTLPKEKRDAEYALAQQALEQSLTLKPDYAPAHFTLIQLFDRRGKTGEVIARAETLRALAPNDVELLFQLGFLHYQANRFGKAREMFETATRLSPQYANALYFLGLIYDEQGERVLALDMFEKVRALNPDNADIAVIIDNIRNNRSALNKGGKPRPLEEKTPAVIEVKTSKKQ